MLTGHFFKIFIIVCLLGHDCILQSMDINDLAHDGVYYSDSEDEEDYTYKGLPSLVISEEKTGKDCVALARGIHFSPSKFTRQDISHMRRSNDAGRDIFSSAAYDLANESLGSAKCQSIIKKALSIRKIIKALPVESRHTFQSYYINQYDTFHKKLNTDVDEGIFKKFSSKKNPEVSTAEKFSHAGKYASGLRPLGEGVESLNPEYDEKGKPKHPYLGKLFVILASTDQMQELDPYFAVYAHANDNISLSCYYLPTREVAFPGFVPGDCVVFSMPIRVPSFEGDYKPFYQDKFGISKRAYKARKKILTTGKHLKDGKKDPEVLKKETVKSLLADVILPHIENKLKKHIETECEKNNINIVYKQLDGEFGTTLPSLKSANDRKRLIKK